MNINQIHEFINKNFENTANYRKCILYLKKLYLYLEQFNISDIEVLLEIIKNNKLLENALNVVAEKNIKLLKSGKENKEDISTNYFMELYCVLHNIDISVVEVEDYYFEDAYKSYVKEVISIPLLSDEEEMQLGERILNGDMAAVELLTKHNLRLVIYIASQYKNRGLPILDLIQEGNIGLMKAARKFDISKGFKFSTYATWWIRDGIKKALDNQVRMIRIPAEVYEKVKKFNRIKNELTLENEVEPTLDQIALSMGITLEEAKNLEEYQEDTISLNSKVGDEDDAELGDFIESDSISTEEIAVRQLLQKDIAKLLEMAQLTDGQLEVIKARFGFLTGYPQSLAHISRTMKVSEVRVKQYERTALRKIRTIARKNNIEF